MIDGFQSAYKAGHSCETALLRVYNDIVISIGKSNGSFLGLLDLSAAFDTIDHDNLFMILERFVGISGSALRLIKSYFSGRTQRVVIDGILSDFANLVCGVPQGSVLGPMKLCLYLLPLCAIIFMRTTHNSISLSLFNSKEPLTSLTKLNNYISDIRVWMIKNKLKINVSKTESIIFRSLLLKTDLSGVSISVGDSQIIFTQSSLFGVIFSNCLSLDAHMSNICRSTTHI